MIADPVTAAILVIIAYLMGSLSSAIIVCRSMGLPDPRTQGSHNPGATNVMRVGGKKAAALTLAGDVLKGVFPVLAALWIQPDWITLSATSFAAFIGHLYPVFFGFRGGKGVATALGVLLASSWMVGLATIATWLVVFALSRISALSALSAFLVMPVYAYFLVGEPVYTGTLSVITVMLFWRHRSNIRNLIDGTEA
ncbi:MAG TPA: glycerol-3-phosphate 1-O-acyltransferase [Gammaproteobacteria bacterium]|nr:glycerol-3-phosphate 1-O-acyltransferase [Gammaproteobacteria bacterium]